MSTSIDYYYSVRSVYAYFGAPRINELARRFGRRLRHLPIDLSQVVPAAGSQPFEQRSATHRNYYFGRELQRWGQWLNMPVNIDPVHHYGDRLLPSGVVLAAQAADPDGQRTDALSQAILTALWRDDRDIASEQVLAELARACGFDAAALLAAARSPEMAQQFQACTQQAMARGVLGSPSYDLDGELFYGQDRLMFVERHLQRPFE